MPANSGAITGTVAHKHSALGSDGGFLDDGVTGVTGTANGSLIYFDGSSIAQDLPSGNANDVLTMGATLPSWQPVTSASVWTELADVSVVNSPLSSGTFSAMTQLDVWIKSANTASQNTAIIFNNFAGSYNNNQWVDSTFAGSAGTNELPIWGGNSSDESFIHLSIFNPSSGVIGYTWSGTNYNNGSGGTPISFAGNGYSYGSQVTRIDRTLYGGAPQNQTGRIVVFGANP